MHREKMFDLLNEMEHAMTEVDLILWTWQTDLDMMSFIGQDSTKTYVPDTVMYNSQEMDSAQVDLTVQRVPLVRYEGAKRIVIGVADVDKKSGVYKATVQSDYAALFTIPNAYSIRDDYPPEYDHDLIKAQLRRLVSPEMYVNPFKIQGVTAPMPTAGDKTVLKVEPIPAVQAEPTSGLVADILSHKFDLPVAMRQRVIGEDMMDLDNHPFFRDDAMERRCIKCEHLVRQCICKKEN